MPSVGTRRSDTKVLSSLKRTTPGRSPIERHHACPPQGVHSTREVIRTAKYAPIQSENANSIFWTRHYLTWSALFNVISINLNVMIDKQMLNKALVTRCQKIMGFR